MRPLKLHRKAIELRRHYRSDEGAVECGPDVGAVRPYFDNEFYLARYSDVAKSGIDPIYHYLTFGWIEGREPAPNFSTELYLNRNPDIKIRGINPFVHYCQLVRHEGRASLTIPGLIE